MVILLKILSYGGLALTVVPSFLALTGAISMDTHKGLMIGGMFLWFLTAPWWINKSD